MRSGRTPPYIRPKVQAFSTSNWHQVGKGELQDGSLIPEWDQNLTLTVTRMVDVDWALALSSGRLSPGARLAMVPTWWSDGTGLRGRGEPQDLTIDASLGRKRFDIALTIPGTSLSRHLQLRAALVLMQPAPGMIKDPLAPKRIGSVLWEDAVTVILEGEAPRFPITVVDFAEAGLGPDNACWRFDWNPTDPTLPAMATMRLLINSRHRTFHAAVTSREPTPAQLAMRSALKHGVGMEMLRLALDHADDLDQSGDDLVPGSSGRVLLELVERLFPDQGVLACVERRRHSPGDFLADVQARLGLFDGDGISEEGS